MIPRVSFLVCLLCMTLVNAKSTRIVGGDIASPGQFKYQVSVQVNYEHQCGGAIIADQYILTAGHCVIEDDGLWVEEYYQVVAGATNLITDCGVRVDVESIYVPTNFIIGNRFHDIAVLKLQTPLNLDSNPNLQKVNLPPIRDPSYIGQTGVIAGYGFTSVEVRNVEGTEYREEVNGVTSDNLKYATVNIISNQECDRKIPALNIIKKQICGYVAQRGQQPEGLCTGDSGGPLVRNNIVIGLVSFTPLGCREDEFPAVYTRVSSYLNFISKAMKNVRNSSMRVRDITL